MRPPRPAPNLINVLRTTSSSIIPNAPPRCPITRPAVSLLRPIRAPVRHSKTRRIPVGTRWQSTIAEPETASTLPPAPPTRSLPVRASRALFFATSCIAFGFIMTVAPAIPTAVAMATPPTDEETLALYTPSPDTSAVEIEAGIWDNALTKSLVADASWSASRPHLKIPEAMRQCNLVGGTLMGGNMIGVPPLAFLKNGEEKAEFVTIQYLGEGLCGHPGIIHGGLLATLLDEGLARCGFAKLPNRVGVTASLKVDYRKPCAAGQYVVLRAETTKFEGRKVWVKGRIETLVDEGKGEVPELLVEAEGLFIEPKGAAKMARIYSPSR